MAETLKILGQSAPAASTNTTFYTVPASTSATVSTITICNTNASAVTVRLHTAASGGSATTSNANYYGITIGANDTLALTGGITLATGEFLVAWASSTLVCFQAYGVEVT